MTKFYGEEKPSLEEALVHFGVIGMKWGIRKPPKGRGVVGGAGKIVRDASVQSLRDANFRRARRRNLGARFVPGYSQLSKFNQANLARSQRRIQTGQTRAIDVLRVSRHLTYGDLLIKTTPIKPHIQRDAARNK